MPRRSNLDAKLRVQMRVDVAELQSRLGVTTVYVTHDQVEAMTMGDRVAILDRGCLLQVDAPQDIYRAPVNLFVATFIGSPAMNLVLGRLVAAEAGEAGQDGFTLEVGSQSMAVPASVLDARPALHDWVGRPVVVGVRPEQLRDLTARVARREALRLRASVGLVETLGSEVLAHFTLPEACPHEVDLDQADPATDDVDEEQAEPIVRRFVARLDGDSEVQAGDDIELGVQIDQLHWFDPDSGDAIGWIPADRLRQPVGAST